MEGNVDPYKEEKGKITWLMQQGSLLTGRMGVGVGVARAVRGVRDLDVGVRVLDANSILHRPYYCHYHHHHPHCGKRHVLVFT